MIRSSVARVVNMYAQQPTACGPMLGGMHNSQSNPVQQSVWLRPEEREEGMRERERERRNSWFQVSDYHAGGAAPSGSNAPEFWNGEWEGRGRPDGSIPKNAQRSAAAKHARNEKKKEKQELIEAKAKGNATGQKLPNSDTADKRRLRSGAADLHNIVKNKRVEYGPDPERAFPSDVVECARLGSRFLELASTGEHYATKKALRAELMRERKARGEPGYQGYLAEYQSWLGGYKMHGRKSLRKKRMLLSGRGRIWCLCTYG